MLVTKTARAAMLVTMFGNGVGDVGDEKSTGGDVGEDVCGRITMNDDGGTWFL